MKKRIRFVNQPKTNNYNSPLGLINMDVAHMLLINMAFNEDILIDI